MFWKRKPASSAEEALAKLLGSPELRGMLRSGKQAVDVSHAITQLAQLQAIQRNGRCSGSAVAKAEIKSEPAPPRRRWPWWILVVLLLLFLALLKPEDEVKYKQVNDGPVHEIDRRPVLYIWPFSQAPIWYGEWTSKTN